MALGLRACRGRLLDLAYVDDDWLDAAAPVAALGPAPGDRVGYRKQVLLGGSAVLVSEGVAASRAAGELDQVLIVPAEQRVVLFEHQYRVCSCSSVVDDGAKAGGPPFTFVAVAAGRVVDGLLDVGGDDRRGDRVLATIVLVLTCATVADRAGSGYG